MRNVDGAPIKDVKKPEFPGCLFGGILVAILGLFFLLINTLKRIRDILLCRKLVDFREAAI